MSREKAMQKILKLLNMTEANGCTESESAAAAGMAQKLMLKHSLASADLEVEEEDEQIESWADPLDEMKKNSKQAWRGQLATMLCRHNGCSVFWRSSFYHNPQLVIIGRASDAATTRYLYLFCSREIERLRKLKRGNGQVWLANYRLGLVEGIEASLDKAREEARQEFSAETGTALMVVDRKLAVIDERNALSRQFARDKFNVKRGKGYSGRHDEDARETGRLDGQNIDMANNTKQLKSQSKRLK